MGSAQAPARISGDTGRAEPNPVARRGGVQQILIVIGVVGLAAFAAGLAAIAAVRLRGLSADDPWRPVAADVLTTAYQALIIGALGGLLKIWIDKSRRRADDKQELVKIRTELIDGVVHSSHQLDTGRTMPRANQSVRTLSDVMTDIVIPARVRLREISHDLRTWKAAQETVLDEEAFLAVTYFLHRQVRYTDDVLDEFAKHKRQLGELQWFAEQAKTLSGGNTTEKQLDIALAASRKRRRKALDNLDKGLEKLVKVRDFVEGTGGYGEFRSFYFETLTALRETVRTGTLSRPRPQVPVNWTGIPAEGEPAEADVGLAAGR